MLDKKLREEVFLFLESLRKEGSINMFSAGSVVAESFELSEKEGKELLADWIKSKTVSVSVSGVSSKAHSGDV
tara:strand:- start:6311 stop:6529 length:219 start_codon:yes stop_codon:yes gene_type:complete